MSEADFCSIVQLVVVIHKRFPRLDLLLVSSDVLGPNLSFLNKAISLAIHHLKGGARGLRLKG